MAFSPLPISTLDASLTRISLPVHTKDINYFYYIINNISIYYLFQEIKKMIYSTGVARIVN